MLKPKRRHNNGLMLLDDDYASLVPNPPTRFGLTELRDAYVDAVADEENPRPMAEERCAYFDALAAPRMHQRNPATIRALAETTPVTYLIFDLLHIGNRPLIELPYTQRREFLEQVGLAFSFIGREQPADRASSASRRLRGPVVDR
ncbi:hypothetical protein ACFV24_16310 [Nocardia fluminea]|uniref:ATP-dependent DNA ligase n=1 Tax=Nocardia fluminea TaxID=134984 RepID=UPI00366D3ADD